MTPTFSKSLNNEWERTCYHGDGYKIPIDTKQDNLAFLNSSLSHKKFGRKLIPGGEIANRFGPGNWVSGSPSPEIKTHNHLQAMNVDTFNVVKRSHLLVCGWQAIGWKPLLLWGSLVGDSHVWHQLRNMIGSFWTQLWLISWMFNIVSQPNSQKARFQCSSIGQFQSSILRCPTTDLKFTVYKSFVDIKRSVIFCSDKLRTNLSTDCVQQRESVPYTVVPYQTHQLWWKTVE